ncbi:hypothetical protein BN2476_1550006 [Paraburkholderia piptadeniae]|uniref:Uncharacterized protein n=1 Tax=Paraburkholderia piptadeniae TaxID=1701573 RepID=A0A1N7SWT5_9BURK|nr:hypothetical protein BN2476_1550006 [Paraburkholderia piptadeniae]
MLFSHASGNLNPMHIPGIDVDGDGKSDTVATSMWVGSLVSCSATCCRARARCSLPSISS